MQRLATFMTGQQGRWSMFANALFRGSPTFITLICTLSRLTARQSPGCVPLPPSPCHTVDVILTSLALKLLELTGRADQLPTCCVASIRGLLPGTGGRTAASLNVKDGQVFVSPHYDRARRPVWERG